MSWIQLNALKENLYHVEYLLKNAALDDNERVILQALLIKLKDQIAAAQKPN